MQKVTITEKEKQSKDIDWTKGYFISEDKDVVVSASDNIPFDNNYFCGIAIFANTKSTYKLGQYRDGWKKTHFRPFEGTITVEME